MELRVFSHLNNTEVIELWNRLSSLRKVVWELSREPTQQGKNESEQVCIES